MRSAVHEHHIERALTIAGVAIPLLFVALLVFGEWDRGRPVVTTSHGDERRKPVRIPATPLAEEIADTFQGWIIKTDGTTEWAVLTISELEQDTHRFKFTLNVGPYLEKNHGLWRPSAGTIDFGGLHGVVRRGDDGRIVLKSWPDTMRPQWELSASTIHLSGALSR